jgi:hypothetical protein
MTPSSINISGEKTQVWSQTENRNRAPTDSAVPKENHPH